jgi:hypothetical protein
MKPRLAWIAFVIGLSFGPPLVAAEAPLDAEALAQPREGESATLMLDSIRRFGEALGRFDVRVAWADDTRPAPGDYFPRRVRYQANCEEGTITLAAVAVFDGSGQLQKTMVVPPGASDPVTPQKGSQPAKWLRRVCMF